MKLSRWALALWNAIKKFTNLYGDRGCFFSQRWFAEQIRRKTRTVQYALAELVKAGIVEVEKRYKRTNLYRLKKQPVAPQNCASEPLRGKSNLRVERMQVTPPLVVLVYKTVQRAAKSVRNWGAIFERVLESMP